ncbi:pleckstrin homology domain-containing family J member 1 isoform X1 [Rattus rattus]|uniref:pleckstrin homology domain-containing family J member 1 isoform X1 n=1 Tax=Rattus rattus TaxID=10117 RepID=UPI0013F37B3B|nr:pleckstrin homology domain-containing family J member 1 isoform X1 [Rattus rattus]
MRYNEKELQALSRQPAEMAAELGMRGPKKGSVAKRRLVKLVVNFLFYFRPDEAEPLGALLLERCRVAQEEPGGFSISFVEDLSRKYHFECCSQEQCQEWMEALQRASYEYMRRSLIFYRNEIRKMTGKVCGAGGTGQFSLALLTTTVHSTGPAGAVRHLRGGQVPAE